MVIAGKGHEQGQEFAGRKEPFDDVTVAREALREALGVGADRPHGRVGGQVRGRTLLAGDPATPGPRRAVVDSREVEPGDLFVGLVGQSADGGEFAERCAGGAAPGRALRRPRRARDAGQPRP